jgi:hypothetical protein
LSGRVGGHGVTTVDAERCREVEKRFVPLWLTTVFPPDVRQLATRRSP